MAKNRKEYEKKNKKTKSSKKSQTPEGKTQPSKDEKCCLTWVGTAYHCLSIVRIIRKASDRVHPASYAKSAKDNLIMPIVKRNCTELTQDLVGGVSEIIEFIISPTRYILNIVSYTIAESTGEIIKKNYAITHPELRAGIDVIFSESAYQAVDKISGLSDKRHLFSRFFNASNKCDNKTVGSSPVKTIAQNMRFRPKL